ncbi:toxin C-terminal domain-containing protein [Streptococcus pluranimalium]
MEELVALNDIKDYTIHPNQTLIVESMINKEAEKLAKELGYDKTNEFSSGRPIFKNKKKNPKFITPDNKSHKGGVWKGADKIKDLKNKTSRKGTYDKDLNKIDD